MKIILGFDTCGETLSICIKSGIRYHEINKFDGLKHAQTLMPLINTMLKDMGIIPGEIDLITCSRGPGSFTGLRIGISTAKGLSYGLGIPYVLVPSLDAMAFSFSCTDEIIVPVLDAKKGRFYAGFYQKGKQISNYLDIEPDKLLDECSRFSSVLLTGPGAVTLFSNINSNKNIKIDPLFDKGISRSIISCGEAIFHESGPSDKSASPIYLRKSEAEINRMGKPFERT